MTQIEKTAMQKLIVQINGAIDIIERYGKSKDFAQQRKEIYISVLDVATELLELERKQIVDAVAFGNGRAAIEDKKDLGDIYFHRKFNQ